MATQKKDQKLVFKTAQCRWSILQYFLPWLSYCLSLGYLFCLVLSSCLRQVLLYTLLPRSLCQPCQGRVDLLIQILLSTDKDLAGIMFWHHLCVFVCVCIDPSIVPSNDPSINPSLHPSIQHPIFLKPQNEIYFSFHVCLLSKMHYALCSIGSHKK